MKNKQFSEFTKAMESCLAGYGSDLDKKLAKEILKVLFENQKK